MADPIAALPLPDDAATARLAEDVAAVLRSGDVVALSGDLGAGKTTFARALLRALADDPDLEVPSPTFTLAQTYPLPRLTVTHFDLYRLGEAAELEEIGFEEAAATGAALVEWPERAGSHLPAHTLTVALGFAGSGRLATISGGADWAARLRRTLAARAFLDAAGWTEAQRRHLQGDASTRRYERIVSDSRHAVLMDSPRQPDGPVIRDGKPYSRIAHLAEDVRPFVAMDAALLRAGFSAPELYAHDLDAGFLLLEDLGRDGILAAGAPDPQRYREAAELLAAIHAEPRPHILPLPDGSIHTLPLFDRDALAIEVSLLTDWYAPHAVGAPLPQAALDTFVAVWGALFDRLDGAEKSWVLRDYHSPNLLWLPGRDGVRQVGLLDFQDAMIGPAAYDLASLLQDARVTVAASLEAELFAAYIAARRRRDPGFDEAALTSAFAIMAAQRATKVLGIFARLDRRDGKPQYLRHIPRLKTYLARTLRHPDLAGLAGWYQRWLPLQD